MEADEEVERDTSAKQELMPSDYSEHRDQVDPDDPNWAQVLQALYLGGVTPDRSGSRQPVDENHPLVKSTHLTPSEVWESAIYLREKANLADVETWSEPSPKELSIQLLPKGFNIAHEREMRKDRQELEQKQGKRLNLLTAALVLVTFLLTIVTGIESAVTAMPDAIISNRTQIIAAFGVLFFLLIALWVVHVLVSDAFDDS